MQSHHVSDARGQAARSTSADEQEDSDGGQGHADEDDVLAPAELPTATAFLQLLDDGTCALFGSGAAPLTVAATGHCHIHHPFNRILEDQVLRALVLLNSKRLASTKLYWLSVRRFCGVLQAEYKDLFTDEDCDKAQERLNRYGWTESHGSP